MSSDLSFLSSYKTPGGKPLARPAPLPEPPQPSSDFTTGQKLALLMLRKGDLANALATKLRAMGAEPAKADWSSLISNGDIIRSVRVRGSSHLTLTPMGLFHAGQVMRDLAKKLDVHQVIYHRDHRNATYGRCTCGYTFANGNTFGSASGLGLYERRHLEQVKAGTYRAPDMEEIFQRAFLGGGSHAPGSPPPDMPGRDGAAVISHSEGR